jgi:glycine cleavage system aminomethyltransferase T
MLGHVTSSYYSPTLKRSIAMAVVRSGHQRMGQKVNAALVDGRPCGGHRDQHGFLRSGRETSPCLMLF